MNNSQNTDMDHEISECPKCHAEKYLGSDLVKVTWSQHKENPETGLTYELFMRNCKGCGYEFSREVVQQRTDKPQ